MATIKTRVLILSDTHGFKFNYPLRSADVAIHCGDLTDESKLSEFKATVDLLQSIDALLKLVIAGNHDLTLDIPAFERKIAEAVPALDPELVAKEYGRPGEARKLLEDAKDHGIIFLDEGNHQFKLANGATLRVYASPFTPAYGEWGLQYPPSQGHDFQIGEQTDIAMTHGPPKGIMDLTVAHERAGCPDLFRAVARAKPAMHCFGHIHEGWGAKLVAWRPDEQEEPCHFNAIDNDKSILIEKLSTLEQFRFDTPGEIQQKLRKIEKHEKERCCATSYCAEDEHPLKRGVHTLFVNAAALDQEYCLTQKTFLIDIDLAATI